MKSLDNKNQNIARIPSKLSGPNANFYKYWLEFMRPMNKLTSKEIDVLAVLLLKRFELSKSIIDSNVLDTILLGAEVKRQIREDLKLSANHFHVVISKLKKVGIIRDNQINKKFVPNVEQDATGYKLTLLFDFSNGQ